MYIFSMLLGDKICVWEAKGLKIFMNYQSWFKNYQKW